MFWLDLTVAVTLVIMALLSFDQVTESIRGNRRWIFVLAGCSWLNVVLLWLAEMVYASAVSTAYAIVITGYGLVFVLLDLKLPKTG